jgi:hypothetical protein
MAWLRPTATSFAKEKVNEKAQKLYLTPLKRKAKPNLFYSSAFSSSISICKVCSEAWGNYIKIKIVCSGG